MKLLHSADWHLDSPLVGRTSEQAAFLRSQLLRLPQKVVSAAKAQGCQLILLAGDLFDGPYTRESYTALRDALEDAGMPVFIAPGNHDYVGKDAPWTTESWPKNVHIFTRPAIESVHLPELDCRIYGAAFTGPDAPSLLEDFRAEGSQRWSIGLLHGDPTQLSSPYNPITTEQVSHSGLDYLALGHIHKGGSFQAGSTLCLWPGCPMGRGFDELGPKGVQIVTLENQIQSQFLPLDTIRFYDLEGEVVTSPEETLTSLLPPVGSRDLYRITLTGQWPSLDAAELAAVFPQFPNLELRDRTTPPVDLWSTAGEDTLEGVYFQLLKDALESGDETAQRQIRLAAKISRQILDGQEVDLP